MDLTSLVLDIYEALIRTYSIIRNRPYVTAEVVCVPQRSKSGKATGELVAFTVINESGPDIEVQRVWFISSFNRHIFSEFIDSKMPMRVSRKNRETYFVPLEEFGAALNKSVGETITKAVVSDKTGRRYESRIGKVAQEELAK